MVTTILPLYSEQWLPIGRGKENGIRKGTQETSTEFVILYIKIFKNQSKILTFFKAEW